MILDDPFDDPAGLPIPDRSPEPTKEQLDVSLYSVHNPVLHYCEANIFGHYRLLVGLHL